MHSLVLAFSQHLVNIDLAELDGAEGLASDDGVLGDLSGQVGGHLVASVEQVLVLGLEPLAGHGVLLGVPLHGLDINVVAGVEDVQLSHDTGHVADLGLHVVPLLGKLLNEPVSKVEVVSSGPLEAHGVEHVLEVRHAAHLVLVVVGAPVVVHPVRAIEDLAEHVKGIPMYSAFILL